MTETATRHPAKFSDPILREAHYMLSARSTRMLWPEDPDQGPRLLDPFAGTGKGVEFFRSRGFNAVGVELEPEWARQSQHVAVGNALDLPPGWDDFDMVFTSPTYGNRMADHHEAKDESRRNTYRHALGRPLSVGSTACLQWGDEYRIMHERAWREARRVLKLGGYFLLNCKDHIRGGERQHVTRWHVRTLEDMGFELVEARNVPCPGNRQGANGTARIDYESLVLFRR